MICAIWSVLAAAAQCALCMHAVPRLPSPRTIALLASTEGRGGTRAVSAPFHQSIIRMLASAFARRRIGKFFSVIETALKFLSLM